MPPKAILFDLWETLILDRPDRNLPRRAWRSRVICDVLAKHGLVIDGETVLRTLDAASIALTALHDTGADLDEPGRVDLFFSNLDATLEATAPRSADDDLLAIIPKMPVEYAPHLAPYALETLSAIRDRGIKTALVSNAGMTTAPNLRLILEHYGLRDQFDALVFSDELQIAKPDPRIFQAALDELALTAADSAFVGDNPHNDISGALAAGLHAVQIGNKTREGVVPHARIDTLDQLLPALEKGFS